MKNSVKPATMLGQKRNPLLASQIKVKSKSVKTNKARSKQAISEDDLNNKVIEMVDSLVLNEQMPAELLKRLELLVNSHT